MKVLRVALNAGTALLPVSTAICGLWIRGQGAAVDPNSIGFHMTIGLLTVVIGLLAVISGSFARGKRHVSRSEGWSVSPSSPGGIFVKGR